MKDRCISYGSTEKAGLEHDIVSRNPSNRAMRALVLDRLPELLR